MTKIYDLYKMLGNKHEKLFWKPKYAQKIQLNIFLNTYKKIWFIKFWVLTISLNLSYFF